MSIASNSIMTWSDFSSTCLASLKSVCCNIDNYASDVPTRLRSGQSQVGVKTITTSVGTGAVAQTYTWYANPANLISVVTSSTVNTEWNTFLTSAGINSRSNKVIQAREMGLAVGLYMQFMSYHIKPIYSRRQVYNTIETQTLYQGCKYITGTATPTYTLSAIDPSYVPEITNSDISNVVTRNFQANQLMTHYDNPVLHTCSLS